MRRIVIADDNDDYRFLVAIAIKRGAPDRYEVVGEAVDGIDCLNVIASTNPDLVLLDLSMPRMDGLEVLEQISRTRPGIDVVILSGFTADRMESETMAMGAIGYVEKGVSPRGLVSRLDELLELVA